MESAERYRKENFILSSKSKIVYVFVIILTIIVLVYVMLHIHVYFLKIFPAAYPYAATLVAVASIIANFVMAKHILENWMLWIFVGVLASHIYYTKGIKFIAFEYVVFTALASKDYILGGNKKGSYTY